MYKYNRIDVSDLIVVGWWVEEKEELIVKGYKRSRHLLIISSVDYMDFNCNDRFMLIHLSISLLSIILY